MPANTTRHMATILSVMNGERTIYHESQHYRHHETRHTEQRKWVVPWTRLGWNDCDDGNDARYTNQHFSWLFTEVYYCNNARGNERKKKPANMVIAAVPVPTRKLGISNFMSPTPPPALTQTLTLELLATQTTQLFYFWTRHHHHHHHHHPNLTLTRNHQIRNCNH